MNVTCVVQSPQEVRENHVTFVLAFVTVFNTVVHLTIKLLRMAYKGRKPVSNLVEVASH